MSDLKLISHKLCPYVQRAVITLGEKRVDFERVDVDLANKPDWFIQLSPLGKTPVLSVAGSAIFESSVIVEYLEDTQDHPLHPADPLARAQHRAWVEFSSAILNDIGGFYNAPDAAAFNQKIAAMRIKFGRLEAELGNGPWFAGGNFSLVDAAFGPVFRYFDVFDTIADFGVFDDLIKVELWRAELAKRPSVQQAVSVDYPGLLREFLHNRNSHLSGLMELSSA